MADPDAGQFRLAIEAAPIAMILVDERGCMALVNARVEDIFGHCREETLGQPIAMLVPVRFRAHLAGLCRAFVGDPKSQPMGASLDLLGLCRDGTEVPLEIGLNPFEAAGRRFVLGSVVGLTERKRAYWEREGLLGQLRTLNAELEQRVEARTAELQATLKEREVLLEEVHHRVKNNLQVISSLINVQVRSLEDEASREALRECQTRVQAMGLIHEKLYQSKDFARVPFAEYTRSLAANVFHATGVSPEGIALELAIEDVALALDRAIPCGLILNELITNALKHAFPSGRSGTIRVELGWAPGGAVRLVVADDGVGLPSRVDVRDSPSLGLHLVRMLSHQLDATIEVETTRGTCFRLTIPLEA
jgi:PAS domain S-box-containing protein